MRAVRACSLPAVRWNQRRAGSPELPPTVPIDRLIFRVETERLMTPPTATAETPRTRRTHNTAAPAGKTTAAKAAAKAGTKAPVGEATSRSLSTIDLTEELDVPQVAELVARGRENGELSLAELKETLDKADLGAELLPALARRLGEAKVDVVEEDDRPVKPSASEASGTGDLVRLYLREIGKVPLLNAEQGVELSTRVG